MFSGVSEPGRHGEREAWILDLINEAHNANFFVWVDFDRVGHERPRRVEVVRPIETWLSGLDADSVIEGVTAGRPLPETTVPIRDWVIRLRAMPVKPEARGRPDHRLLGIGPGSSGFVNDHTKLTRSLQQKFGHYGSLGEPLVVAVLAMSISVDRETVEDVLFGRVALQIDRPDDVRWIRQRNGVWIRGSRPASSSVAAVAVATRLRPWTCATELPELWLNPWSTDPLACDLPFVTGKTNMNGQTTYAGGGIAAHEIFNLPHGWPGPERPFE